MPPVTSTDAVRVVLDRASVVFVGSLNPTIFQPAWFGRHQLLREAEAEAAEIKILNPQLAHFQTDWLELQVSRNRFFALDRNGGKDQLLLDLVSSVFNLLEHTPITGVGMNREVQLEFDSKDRWDRFGHLVAPKDVWNEILPSPGLVVMQVQSQREGDGNNVNVIVTNQGPKRADIDINEHRNLPNGAGASAVRLLREQWTSAFDGAKGIADDLIRRAI